MVEEVKEGGAMKVEIAQTSSIKDIFTAYRSYFFDKPFAIPDDKASDAVQSQDDEDSDGFEPEKDSDLICYDTTVKYDDFPEHVMVKILTYMDSDFFYMLYR